jgi:hypothetical protein
MLYQVAEQVSAIIFGMLTVMIGMFNLKKKKQASLEL